MNGRGLVGFGLGAILMGACAVASAKQPSYLLYDVYTNSPADVQRLGDSSVMLMREEVIIGANQIAVFKGQELIVAMLGLKSRFLGVYEPEIPTEFEDADYRTQWLTYDQLMAEWDGLLAAYPWLIKKKQIGVTRESRPIHAYRFFRPEDNDVLNPSKSMLFIGDTHAREWISPSAMLHIGKMLAQELGTSDTTLTSKLVDKIGVWFVPVFNVDGYIYSWTNVRMWRKNRRNNGGGIYGVDINRNYAKGWGGEGSSGTPSSDIYRGPSPASEPETQAIVSFSESLPNLLAVIDLHSYGGKILFPWSYTATPPPAPAVALFTAIGDATKNAIIAAPGPSYTVGQASTTLYISAGSSKDWFYDRFGIPSYTIEIAGTQFDPPTTSIAPTQDHIWAGFRAFVMASAP